MKEDLEEFEEKLHLLPATAETLLKLNRYERRFFTFRAITELAARTLLTQSRRVKASRPETNRASNNYKGPDRQWNWTPQSVGRPPGREIQHLLLARKEAKFHGKNV